MPLPGSHSGGEREGSWCTKVVKPFSLAKQATLCPLSVGYFEANILRIVIPSGVCEI